MKRYIGSKTFKAGNRKVKLQALYLFLANDIVNENYIK
jgi:hypothetical protein